MKKKSISLIIMATVLGMLFSGCSASSEDLQTATEFVNDESVQNAVPGEDTQDQASADQSLIIVDKLAEPLLEATEAISLADTKEMPDASNASGGAERSDNQETNEDSATDSSSQTDAEKTEDTKEAEDKKATEDKKDAESAQDSTAQEISTDSGQDSKDNDKSKDSDKDKDSDKAKGSEDSSEESKDEKKEEDKVRIVFMGDSQIAGGRTDGTDIAGYVGKRVPNSVVYNLGIGGTTASVEASTTKVDPADLHSTSFLGMTYCLAGRSDREATLSAYPDILNTMNQIDPKEVDYYFIGYGTNDFINNVPLDVSTYATDGEQCHAFFNAMMKSIDILQDISPNAQFIIITPFYGIYATDDGTYIGDSYIVSNGTGTLADYAKKAINVTEEKSLYYFDGMFITKCDLYLDTADKYLSDKLHLNVTGRQIVGRLLAHYVNYLEKNEPFAYLDADFIKIAEFDPDETYRMDESVLEDNYPESWEKYINGEFPLAQPSKEALAYWKQKQEKDAAKEESKDTDSKDNESKDSDNKEKKED